LCQRKPLVAWPRYNRAGRFSGDVMPFYEYKCDNCGHHEEALQKISDKPLKKCPQCGKNALKKQMSAPLFRLKGSGWYETDFKSDKENKRNLAGAEKEEAKSEAKTETKPDAKPDAKTDAKTDAKSESKPETKAEAPKADAAKPAAEKSAARKPSRTNPKPKTKARRSRR
jgi:putative FmdB family regulatory protein